jgi:2-oxoglutarate/2-oxoacid ferredoxin oxidoreductase subunit alpha
MVEGVSLAGMTETPLVVVLAQRPAPATGLPTRTEQADLDFILHAGHGEFPRAVFAPGNAEECFHLIRKALELAESAQTPIFLLSDQYLADSYRATTPFDLKGLSWIHPGSEEPPASLPYLRYALTDNGLSPRFLPGKTEHLVVADSDEHTEDGHITEDLSVRKRMVEKRLAKMKVLVEQTWPPEFSGDTKPDLLGFLQRTRSGGGRRIKITREKGRDPLLFTGLAFSSGSIPFPAPGGGRGDRRGRKRPRTVFTTYPQRNRFSYHPTSAAL